MKNILNTFNRKNISDFLKLRLFRSLYLIYKDISNYLFFRKKVKTLEKTEWFSKNKMRTNWFKSIYYVLNLQPENLMPGQDSLELEKIMVYESVGQLQNTLVSNNIFEIIQIDTERIKTSEYYAYLIVLKYRRLSNWRNFTKVIVVISSILYLLYYKHMH